FFFSSRRRHTRSDRDWSSDVCSSDLPAARPASAPRSSKRFNDSVAGRRGRSQALESETRTMRTCNAHFAATTIQTIKSYQPLSTDRKSTRLNSSHDQISYAVFCLKKK